MKITPLKMWVQNVLPVVYDDSLSYYEMVGKINEKTNEIINQVNENTDDIESLKYVIQELGDIDALKALLKEVETIVNDLYTSDTPVMDSEGGSAGVADHAARSDHSHPSDSSKADSNLGITGALAGQFVKIKTVEAGVPTEFENGMPHEIPSGGTTGQALRKESNGDYAVDWGDVHEVPNGGSAGQILRKNSGTNYDAGWSNEHGVPAGGADGDVLVKNGSTDYSTNWSGSIKTSLLRLNKIGVTLWKGDFVGAGSITVTGLSDYRIIAIFQSDNDLYPLIGTITRGGILFGAYGAAGINQLAYRFNYAAVNTLEVSATDQGITDGTDTTYTNGSGCHIKKIIGLIPN